VDAGHITNHVPYTCRALDWCDSITVMRNKASGMDAIKDRFLAEVGYVGVVVLASVETVVYSALGLVASFFTEDMGNLMINNAGLSFMVTLAATSYLIQNIYASFLHSVPLQKIPHQVTMA